MKYSWFILILLLFLLMHIPFLQADPDILSDRYSRGAWTDEGLYTSQIRNWVNHGDFSMWENDAFIKTPLFGILHIPFFKIFGTGLIISRLIVLFTVFFSLLLFAKVKEFRIPALFIVLLAFSQYHIFQYSHYGLAEMMSISAIVLSSLFLYQFYETRKNWQLFLSALLIIISILLKIQFVYAIVIIPVTTFIIGVSDFIKSKKRNWKIFIPFLLSMGFLILFIILLFLIYYLPNQKFIQYMYANEGDSRYPSTWENIRKTIDFNFKTRFVLDGLISLDVLLSIALVISFVFLFIKRTLKFKIPILFGFVWLLSELNKVVISNVPTRYSLSLIFAAIFFISFVIAELSSPKQILYKLNLLIVIVVCFFQLSFTYKAFNRRSNCVKKVNDYLIACNINNQTIIGPWSSTLAGNTKAKTFPIWYKYIGNKDPIHSYKPRLVVTEFDEMDSGYAYRSEGINLSKIADSSRSFNIWKYSIDLYWINQDSL
jgi:hypothetical protein